MATYIPGTVIEQTLGTSKAFARFTDILAATGGVTLSQVTEITGLQASTIQNWVKRGWVSRPSGKRYGEEQLARILLINMMKGSMQLESIIKLMSYINGKVDDRSDDIIPDRELFNLLCEIIGEAEAGKTFDFTVFERLIDQQLKEYKGPDELSCVKLKKALRVMTGAYVATKMRSTVDSYLAELI